MASIAPLLAGREMLIIASHRICAYVSEGATVGYGYRKLPHLYETCGPHNNTLTAENPTKEGVSTEAPRKPFRNAEMLDSGGRYSAKYTHGNPHHHARWIDSSEGHLRPWD